MKYTGRREPYTQAGISRVKCARCGRPAQQQWQICANNNYYVGVCDRCDVAVNELVLKFMKIPNAMGLMKKYRRKMQKSKNST